MNKQELLRAQRMMRPYWSNYGGEVPTQALEEATAYVAERFAKSGMDPDEAEDDQRWRTETVKGIQRILGIKSNPVKSRKENYDDFNDWETDAFRAGATQVVRLGEDLFSAIKMKDGSLVKLDEEGFVDMRSRAGQKVRKESITVGAWYGDRGEIYRQMIRNNPVVPRKGESSRSFVSRCMSEEKASFPKTKQRIAVCLSKSRKRNPLESGANISDDQDINVQASNMG
jgi:hypothetical protein